MREVHGKVAFITGGASGIGFALAHAFGRANMKVMLADIELDALDSAVAELKSEGIDARGVECDVADRASVQRAAAETLAAFDKVHIVCSNAGVIASGPMELITPGDWDWVIGVNLMGFVRVIQAFLPHLKSHGEGGHIVVTSAMGGMLCVPGNGPHCASKFGLVALVETLAAELAGTPIGVSVLCSSFVRTRGPTVPAIAQSVTGREPRLPRRRRPNSLPLLTRAGSRTTSPRKSRAIEENELYIFVDPEYRSILEERFQRILAAFPPS